MNSEGMTREELMAAAWWRERPRPWYFEYPQYLTCYLPLSKGEWHLVSDFTIINPKRDSEWFKASLFLTLVSKRISVLRCFVENSQLNNNVQCFQREHLAQSERVWLLTFDFYDLAAGCLKADQVIDLTTMKKMRDYWKNTFVEKYVTQLDIPGYVILPPEKYPMQPEILPPPGPREKYSIQTLFKSMINCMTSAWCGIARIIQLDTVLGASIYTHGRGPAWIVASEDFQGTPGPNGSHWGCFQPNGSQPIGSQTTCSELRDYQSWKDDLGRQWKRLSNSARKIALLMLFFDKTKPGKAEFNHIFGSAPKPMSLFALRRLHDTLFETELWGRYEQGDIPYHFPSTEVFTWGRQIKLFFEECDSFFETALSSDVETSIHLQHPFAAETFETETEPDSEPAHAIAHETETEPGSVSPDWDVFEPDWDVFSDVKDEVPDWADNEESAEEQVPDFKNDFQPDSDVFEPDWEDNDDFQPDSGGDCVSVTHRGSQPERRQTPGVGSQPGRRLMHRVVPTSRFSPYQGVYRR